MFVLLMMEIMSSEFISLCVSLNMECCFSMCWLFLNSYLVFIVFFFVDGLLVESIGVFDLDLCCFVCGDECWEVGWFYVV